MNPLPPPMSGGPTPTRGGNPTARSMGLRNEFDMANARYSMPGVGGGIFGSTPQNTPLGPQVGGPVMGPGAPGIPPGGPVPIGGGTTGSVAPTGPGGPVGGGIKPGGASPWGSAFDNFQGGNWDSILANAQGLEESATRYGDDLTTSAGLGASTSMNEALARGGGGAGSLLLGGAMRNTALTQAGAEAAGIKNQGRNSAFQGRLAAETGRSGESLELTRQRSDAEQRQYDRALEQQRYQEELAALMDRFGQTHALDRDRFGEEQSQWDDRFGLDRDRFGFDRDRAEDDRDRWEQEFGASEANAGRGNSGGGGRRGGGSGYTDWGAIGNVGGWGSGIPTVPRRQTGGFFNSSLGRDGFGGY